MVPCFDLPGRTASSLLVSVGDDFFADCTRVQAIPQDELGPDIHEASDELWTRVRIGVRSFLCIDQLTSQQQPLRATIRRTDWWPHQGDVRYRYVPAAMANKMHAVVTDDAWNSVQPYSCACQLTSTSKAWR